jgi:hypothetical protein
MPYQLVQHLITQLRPTRDQEHILNILRANKPAFFTPFSLSQTPQPTACWYYPVRSQKQTFSWLAAAPEAVPVAVEAVVRVVTTSVPDSLLMDQKQLPSGLGVLTLLILAPAMVVTASLATQKSMVVAQLAVLDATVVNPSRQINLTALVVARCIQPTSPSRSTPIQSRHQS